MELIRIPHELENCFLRERYAPKAFRGGQFQNEALLLQEMAAMFADVNRRCIDVMKQSVHFELRRGKCNRLTHVKELPVGHLPIIEEKYSTSLGRHMLNQLRIVGTESFGLSGDSGSLVYAEVKKGKYRPLAIFTGSMEDGETGQTIYVATPIDFLIGQCYEIYRVS